MMHRALEEARRGASLGEVPVGAVLYDMQGRILAAAHNKVEQQQNVTAHAEMLAIETACKNLSSKLLTETFMAVTLEPCAMCAQAISYARVQDVRFGAYDPKSGGVVNGARIFEHKTCHYKPVIYGGILEEECGAMLTAFFKQKRRHETGVI